MDISDDTEGSHLAQLDEEGQRYILDLLSNNQTEQIDQYDCHHLESIIKKVSRLQYI